MGALETLTRMINLKAAVDKQQGSQITPDMRYVAAQQEKRRVAEFEKLKYITGRYTDLYFKSKHSPALQENILQTMKGVKESLPPIFAQQFNVFIKTGPFSETAEKKRKWYEIKGAPPRSPSIEERKDKSLAAQYEFARADYDYEMQHFLTGQAPASKPRVVGLEDGFVGIRGASGAVHITTDEMLTGKVVAEELDQNFGTLLANDFKVPGESRPFISGGQEFETKKYYDRLTNKQVTEIIPGKHLNPRKHWESKLLTEVLAYVTTKTDDKETVGGKLAKRVLDAVDKAKGKDIQSVENTINQAVVGIPEFHNVYLSVADKGYDPEGSWFNVGDWFGQYGLSDEAAIVPIYGEMTAFRTLDGKEVVGFYDKQMDIVYSADGLNLGSYNSATSYFEQRSSEEFFGER